MRLPLFTAVDHLVRTSHVRSSAVADRIFIVWGYALAWFVVTDGFKVLAYRNLVTPVSSTPG